MIISTFNVRGLGGRVKKNKIRDLVRQSNIEFLAIQETKLVEVTPSLCFSIWGGEDCDWVFRASEGRSGGILSIWRKFCATLVSSFQGDGYVGVTLDWGVEKTCCIIINVYSKCDLSAKRILWENLIGERQNREGGVWCVLGDFNVVRRRDERRGVNLEALSTQILEMFLFNSFLGDMELEDLNVLGRRFTWYHPNGRSMSMIDRMLVSEEWGNVWGDNALWVLPRDVSDHCPSVLKNGGWSWEPTPFRFNNFLLQHHDFKRVVEGLGGIKMFRDG